MITDIVNIEGDVEELAAEQLLALTGEVAQEPSTGVTAFAGMVACYE